jgi:hypothetical protein
MLFEIWLSHLDQSTVGKIPYMYLPQSEKDCYVVVVIQRKTVTVQYIYVDGVLVQVLHC